MNYYAYLKRNFVVYCISGLFLACAIFGVISLHRYNDYLLNAQSNINSIGVNKFMMKKQAAEISALQENLQRQFNLDVSSSNSDILIFEALDSMRSRLKGARIIISKFKESGNEKSLPIEVDTYPATYSSALDHLKYIESFRLPDFKIDQLILAGDYAGKVLLKIKGSFAMPPLEAHASEFMGEMP